MKVEKFKVLLYLKKSGLDKNGKAPIMGRITLNRTMAQFGCKLSCTPKLWNPRESRLDGKSKEAVEVNAKIDKLLLAINSAYESLVERKTDFDAKAIKDLFQCSADTQMTLLKQLDAIIADIESRIGIDYKKGTLPNYQYTRLTLVLFVKKRYGTDDVAFGELDEQFIREYMDFCLDQRGLALDTVRHYLAILKKTPTTTIIIPTKPTAIPALNNACRRNCPSALVPPNERWACFLKSRPSTRWISTNLVFCYSCVFFFLAAIMIYTSNATNATRMQIIWVIYFSGSIQISLKKSKRPSTSTGTQNTTTVAIAIRILAPHVLKRNCFRKMKKLPTRQATATTEVTG